MIYKKSELEVFEIPKVPEGIRCKLCKENSAVVEAPSLGAKLCKECFNKLFESRVKRTIEKYKMFKSSDRVGVFISGGKDSSVLAVVLKRLFPELDLKVIHINLGIRYYSERTEKKVEDFAKAFNFSIHTYRLEDTDGFCIDDFILTRFKHKICSVCGIVKRYLFSKIARQLNLDVIATGHHLDDVVSTMLNLFFQGDLVGVTRLVPVLPPIKEGQAKKVKPLVSVPEKEVFYYAILNEIPFVEENCPHGGTTPSKRLKFWLNQLEKENRQIKYQLLSVFYKKLVPLVKKSPEYQEALNLPVYECIRCGELTSSEERVCSRCKRVLLLKEVEDKLEITFDELSKTCEENLKIVKLDQEKLPGKRALLRELKGFKKTPVYIVSEDPEKGYRLTLWLRKKGIRAINVKQSKEEAHDEINA